MSKIEIGYIMGELDKQYTFTYDGELLQLVPVDGEKITPHDFWNNKLVEKELLKGITTSRDSIFFLKCRLQRNNSGYVAKPAGYVCFKGEINSFRTITFKGEAVNFFYRPNQILGEASDYPWDEDGGGNLFIRKFSEITERKKLRIAEEECQFIVSITRPVFPKSMMCNYTLGEPKSFIKLEFEQDMSIDKFSKVYLSMQNFLEFIFFRKNVYMEKIELGVFDEENLIYESAEVHLLHTRSMCLSNPEAIIGYHLIKDGLQTIFQILEKKRLNLLFIPQNEKEDKYIDPQKYMSCCSSFESVFNFAFPNQKMEENEKMKKAKLSVLNFISEKDEENKGKDSSIRKEYKSLKRIIELTDFSLEQKYRWCLKNYDEDIKDYCKRVYFNLNLTDEQIEVIPTKFAFKRNILTHANMDALEVEDIAAYSILRYLVYVIILDKCGIDKNTIRNAINCILT